MKIFIVYASAGSGHKKVAEALHEEAVSVYGKDKIALLDILDYVPPFFKFLYSKGYIFTISRMKWFWGFLFYLADSKYFALFNRNFRNFFNIKTCSHFLHFIEQENPDVIISTHFLVNELVSFQKEKGNINSKVISVVTDFGVHNFWISKNIDRYVAASVKTKDILVSKGINEEKIRIFGIPTRKQFEKIMDKERLKESFGLQRDIFTVLILVGGIGIGPIYEIVTLLGDQVNVIVVCGNNEKLYARLKNLAFKKLRVFGWVDTIEEMMCVSDIVITKPGGSSISECLMMGLPMIFFSIIPGQESCNAKTISESGLGCIVTAPQLIKEKILFFKNNPQVLGGIKDKIVSFTIRNSSSKVLNIVNE